MANIAEAVKEIANASTHKMYFVLTKRLMLAVAEKVAQEKGESLGQVSSQTLTNLKAITFDAKIPVLRPLLTRDKLEIIKIAKEIDTYETATGPEVCDALGPKHPETKAKIKSIEIEERKYDKEEFVNTIVASCKELPL